VPKDKRDTENKRQGQFNESDIEVRHRGSQLLSARIVVHEDRIGTPPAPNRISEYGEDNHSLKDLRNGELMPLAHCAAAFSNSSIDHP